MGSIALGIIGTGTNATGAKVTGMGDAFNVRNYGAQGDGITDDYQAIQNTLDAAYSSGGGTVWIPSSSTPYMVSFTLKIPQKVRLIGDGVGASIIKLTDGHTTSTLCTVIEMEDNASISQIEIDGNYIGNITDQNDWNESMSNPDKPDGDGPPMAQGISTGKYFTNNRTSTRSNYCRIDDVYIHDTIRTNLYLIGKYHVVDTVRLKNSYTDHFIYSGTGLTDVFNHFTVSNIYCTGMVRDSGIDIGADETSTVIDSVFENIFIEGMSTTTWPCNTEKVWRAINLRPNFGRGNILRNIRIHDNMVDPTEGASIFIGQPRTVLDGCHMKVTGMDRTYGLIDIRGFSNADGGVVINNTFVEMYEEKATSATRYMLRALSDCRISNSYFISTDGEKRKGINADGQANTVDIEMHGVTINTPCDSLTFNGNINTVRYGFTGSLIDNTNINNLGTVIKRWEIT